MRKKFAQPFAKTQRVVEDMELIKNHKTTIHHGVAKTFDFVLERCGFDFHDHYRYLNNE
jgi:hypothetical protein